MRVREFPPPVGVTAFSAKHRLEGGGGKKKK